VDSGVEGCPGRSARGASLRVEAGLSDPPASSASAGLRTCLTCQRSCRGRACRRPPS
jgi:hypothetical protein